MQEAVWLSRQNSAGWKIARTSKLFDGVWWKQRTKFRNAALCRDSQAGAGCVHCDTERGRSTLLLSGLGLMLLCVAFLSQHAS